MVTDAMNAGVNPGGLQSRLEIRVLLCYILNNIKQAVPLDIVNEKLHFAGIANYFETTYAVSELEENGNIRQYSVDNGVKLYQITDSGKSVTDTLGSNVPYSIKERALQLANDVINIRSNERNNKIAIEKTDKGIYITCSVMEKEMVLASVKILVPDEETAENIKINFMKDPANILIKATEALTGSEI